MSTKISERRANGLPAAKEMTPGSERAKIHLYVKYIGEEFPNATTIDRSVKDAVFAQALRHGNSARPRNGWGRATDIDFQQQAAGFLVRQEVMMMRQEDTGYLIYDRLSGGVFKGNARAGLLMTKVKEGTQIPIVEMQRYAVLKKLS